MRTIIPFPSLQCVDANTGGERQARSEEGASPVPLGDAGGQLPEGEAGPAGVEPPPRARALHNNIIRLIHAVHGRFG